MIKIYSHEWGWATIIVILVEDEIHFLIKCPANTRLRQEYFQNLDDWDKNLAFPNIMSSRDNCDILALSGFLVELFD